MIGESLREVGINVWTTLELSDCMHVVIEKLQVALPLLQLRMGKDMASPLLQLLLSQRSSHQGFGLD